MALSHSMLANVSTRWSQEWGTMVAVVQRQQLWFIVFLQSTSTGVLCFVHVLYERILPRGPLLVQAKKSHG
jgi:hypothetical protein